MNFEERHARVDPDPLIEMRRRLELWAAVPDSRGQPLMSCIVPLSTVRQVVAEMECLRGSRDNRLDEVLQSLQASAVQVRDEMLISRSDWADILAKAFGYGKRS